jgi:hypothetical protein
MSKADTKTTPATSAPASTQATTKKDENAIFYQLVSTHPLTEFNEVNFIDLLEYSLSLSVLEKKRVIDAVPNLSQFQIDELIKVFEDERVEFKKLLPKEGDTIRDLAQKSKDGWAQLREMYVQETKLKSKKTEDQNKIDDLKKNLGI